MSEPRLHHFVPKQFFKPWFFREKDVWVFEKNNGVVFDPYPQSAKKICVQEDLYSYRTRAIGQNSAVVETKILKGVDFRGLKIIEKLRTKEGPVNLTINDMKDLAVFLASLRIRTLEAINASRYATEKAMRDGIRAFDASLDDERVRRELNGQTVESWVENDNPELLVDSGIRIFGKLLETNPQVISSRISRLHLNVILSPIPLLTCDRPMILLADKNNLNFGVAMAISPEKMIFMARRKKLHAWSRSASPMVLATHMNESTMRYSAGKVFGQSKSDCDLALLDRIHGLDFSRLPMLDPEDLYKKLSALAAERTSV